MAAILGWIEENWYFICAIASAFAVSYLRIMYTGESKNKTAEVFLSGAITASIYGALKWLGVPEEAGAFIGGGIGLVGVEYIREKAKSILGDFKHNKGNDQ